MLFTDFKNSKQFLKYSRSELETKTGSLWEAQIKTAKVDYFTKNLSPPMFFEINTLNFQEIFHDIFKKNCRKEFKKSKPKKNYYKKTKKTVFFVYFFY